ncbi:MAG TPA: hypothetical protein VHW69_14020 [Rhizomicrobium sp.]|nr:hypothetical protein [Rhizomicrobium sp.]
MLQAIPATNLTSVHANPPRRRWDPILRRPRLRHPGMLPGHLKINALLIGFMILCLIAHELTGYVDLQLALRTRAG